MKNTLTYTIVLCLSACTSPNVPISDVMHPEVNNNIYLSSALEEAIQTVSKHKEEATKVHLDVHAKEEKLLSDAIDDLKKLHKEAEENARRRFDDIETALRATHKKHIARQN